MGCLLLIEKARPLDKILFFFLQNAVVYYNSKARAKESI